MPNITIANVALSSIRYKPGNPNSMSEAEFKLLVENIKEDGFLQPVLLRPGDEVGTFWMVDGEHRAKGAAEAGMTEVPAVIAADMDVARAVLQRIGMNKRRGELDLTQVAMDLLELSNRGLSTEELTVSGFSGQEVADLLRSVDQTVTDVLPKDLGTLPDDDYEVDDEPTKPFVLEIEFTNREQYKKARRGLKRAAGKGKDLAEGLMKLLGEEKA